eukprot:2611262-Rhodomonas_salina.4
MAGRKRTSKSTMHCGTSGTWARRPPRLPLLRIARRMPARIPRARECRDVVFQAGRREEDVWRRSGKGRRGKGAGGAGGVGGGE